MVTPPAGRLRSLVGAVIVAAVLLVAARQLGPSGAYAIHGGYRAQVDAFLDGRLALSPHPDALAHDLAWTETGVQQVWGLGVPAWQTPFELIGRAAGVSPVPDRIAMLAWLALMVFALLRGFRRREREPWWVGAGTLALTALLPAFLALVRGRLGVYEEAALYAYAAAMMMLGGLASFARRPSAAGYLTLVGLAGLGGLFRPTVWFWGAATLAVATALWLGRERAPLSHAVRSGRRTLAVVALGVALFAAGGGLLYATNAHRFGRGAEFGHRLNLHSLPGNLTATRFSYPFERATAVAAVTELAGSVFGRPEVRSKRGFYQADLHVGQQPIPRWREYYFTTFSWPYVPLLLIGLVLAVLAWRRRSGGGAGDAEIAGEARWLGPWAVLGLVPLVVFYLWSPSVSSRYQLDLAPGFAALLVIAWRAFAVRARRGVAVGALLLAWGGAVATSKVTRGGGANPVGRATAAAMAYKISRPFPVVAHPLPAGRDADDLDWGVHSDIATTFDRCRSAAGAPVDCASPPSAGAVHAQGTRDALGWTVVERRLLDAADPPGEAPTCDAPLDAPSSGAPEPPPDETRCDPPPSIATTGDAEVTAITTSPLPLYLDAFNWDLATRRIGVASYFYVEDPRFIELELSYSPEPGTPAAAVAWTALDWSRAARVAVGLVHLEPVSIADTARGTRIRFESPTPLGAGLRVAFATFGPDDLLDRPRSDFLLHAIRWR